MMTSARPELYYPSCNPLLARSLAPVYWRRLIEVGVPVDIAQCIAGAIAHYDTSLQRPNLRQKTLLTRYSRFVCRAELWRKHLLL